MLSSGKEWLMCRWLTYTGSPVLVADALYTSKHSLIEQSLHSRLGAEPTNGDGFGIGWYTDAGTPDREILDQLSDDARVVLSEPIGDLPGAWTEVPESSFGCVGNGEDALRPFRVKAPPTTIAV
jgi:predicted glutamine amidotransferase